MLKDVKLILWRDEKLGFQFGYKSANKNIKIVEELDSVEDAIKAQKFYNYLIISNYGKGNPFH